MVTSRFGSWLDGLQLDFKLALRMLVRYPLLTIVGGAGMAFGLAAGIGGYEIRAQMVDPGCRSTRAIASSVFVTGMSAAIGAGR